jgi:regulator of protease activity HflC (stomatin/prohibitin superfamily)
MIVMVNEQALWNREQTVRVQNGWIMLVLLIIFIACDVWLFLFSVREGVDTQGHPIFPLLIFSVAAMITLIIMMTGFFTLQPNEARVLVLFGKYRGTVRESGFHWGNPFYSNGQPINASQAEEQKTDWIARRSHGPGKRNFTRNKISLRARTMMVEKLKVNDKRGNPIEIGAVMVWRVEDTAQAVFDVDDYGKYVETQSESALRHLAGEYSYDHGEEHEITLRSNADEVSAGLKKELEERLSRAGVAVEEARLTHLAYAPEIAQAMLRRQQAEAVIAARQKIVQGAVSMVDMALKDLAQKQVVVLDDERKAAMVSNLMVVLCGESEVHPVVNAGTLYS